MTITSNLWGVKDYVYQSVYYTPKNVERIKNIPMTDRQREIYQRENGIRYFRKIPIFNQQPIYSDNPGINAHMDAMRPRIPEPRAEITCSRCWRAVAKHIERVRNNIVVSFRKLVNY
ncbi:hypothetical protein [Symbiopectobacterium purcellii]|uniref:hypothetical protein n=1 Tax=Symbiopectobacterium purcellii TaxID=2871826 RepID=UPI003F86EBCB